MVLNPILLGGDWFIQIQTQIIYWIKHVQEHHNHSVA
jgi:hypothetical protein